MYLLTKAFIALIILYFIIMIIHVYKKTTAKKGKKIVLNIIQCALLIGIASTINDIVKLFL